MRLLLGLLIGLFLAGQVLAQTTPKEVELSGAGRYAEVAELLAGKDPAKLPVMSLTCLCGAYFELKRFSELSSCLDSLDRKLASGERNYYNHDLSAVPELMRSQAALELGQPRPALEHAQKAEKIVSERKIILYYRIKALGLSGLALAVLGQPEAALQKEAELAGLKLTANEELVLADRAMGRARILISLNQSRKALQALDFTPGAITRLAKSLVGQNILLYQELPYEFVKARAELEQGSLDKACSSLDSLLARPKIEEFGSIYRFILYDRGRVAMKQGRLEEAAGYFRRAVEEIERQRLNLDTEIDKIGFVGDKQDVYASLIACLVESGAFAEAFWYAERAKARAMVDLLAQKKRFAVKDGSPEAVEGLLMSLEEAETAQFAAKDQAALGKARKRAAELTAELRRASPEISSLVSVEATPAAQIAKLLKPDESLLEYYLQGQDFFLFSLSSQGLKAWRLRREGLEKELAELGKAVRKPGSEAWKEPAKALGARLLGPLGAKDLSPRTLIVAHGPLHYLPFYLLDNGQGQLGEQTALRFLPSATVLGFLQEPGPGRNEAVVLGDPDLGNPRYALPGALEEAKRVAGMFAKSELYLGREATLANLRAHSGQAGVLHLAAHGVFEPESPLDSAILLAPQGVDDGRLRASELYMWRLSSPLVALSACETGLGETQKGDDVFGLTRGFLFAGARGVLASLWEVSDESTLLLMTSFYANLGGMRPSQALSQAVRSVRGKYAHPFYWAAFSLTGSDR